MASESPINDVIIPHTVPSKPMYGLTDPTFAKKDKCLFISSSSEAIETLIERLILSRSNSEILSPTLIELNSLKEFLNKFLAPYKLSSFNTSLYKASKSFPLQKILKNLSLALFTFLKKLYLSTIIIQESIEAIKRINITILTTIPASKIRFNTEISSITLS